MPWFKQVDCAFVFLHSNFFIHIQYFTFVYIGILLKDVQLFPNFQQYHEFHLHILSLEYLYKLCSHFAHQVHSNVSFKLYNRFCVRFLKNTNYKFLYHYILTTYGRVSNVVNSFQQNMQSVGIWLALLCFPYILQVAWQYVLLYCFQILMGGYVHM